MLRMAEDERSRRVTILFLEHGTVAAHGDEAAKLITSQAAIRTTKLSRAAARTLRFLRVITKLAISTLGVNPAGLGGLGVPW
jgi:hypothetical protein